MALEESNLQGFCGGRYSYMTFDDVWNMTFSGVDHEVIFKLATNMTEMGTTLPTVEFVGSNVTKGEVTLELAGDIPAEVAAIINSD